MDTNKDKAFPRPPQTTGLVGAVLASSDTYIINSLLRCGLDFPTIFSLVWGDAIAYNNNAFPDKLRKIAKDIIQEEKDKEIFDRMDRKLHSIILDLLLLLYKQEVNNLCEDIINSSE